MNFSRQLKEMQLLSNMIRKQDGVFQHSNFYRDLKEFVPFYEDNIEKMKVYYNNDMMVKERLENLPPVNIKDFDNLFTLRTWLKTILYVLFTPVLIIYLLRKYWYVKDTKQRLRDIAGILSSVEVLTRHTKF